MPAYDMLFAHDIDTGDDYLAKGDAFRYDGDVWRVESVEGESKRVVLRLWPNGEPYPEHVKGASE